MQDTRLTFIRSIMMSIMLLLSFGVAVGPFSANVSGSITGDAYSGSGDWDITNPTVYDHESFFTVYGDININGSGSLTLIHTTLIIDQAPGSLDNRIFIHGTTGAPFFKMQDSSVVRTNNATAGKYNAYVTADASSETLAGYFQIEDSQAWNICFDLSSYGDSYIRDSILLGSVVYVYNVGSPIDAGPIEIDRVAFQDTNTTDLTYKSIVDLANNCAVRNCTFTNITLHSSNGQTCSYVRVHTQNGCRIEYNDFGDGKYARIYVRGGDGVNPATNTVISHNQIGRVGESNHTNSGYAFWLEYDGVNNLCDYNRFHDIQNASRGVWLNADGWTLNYNEIDHIDGTGLYGAGSGQTYGISVLRGDGNVIHGTIVHESIGPGLDTGSSAWGIWIHEVQDLTVCHSSMTNLSMMSCGIGVVDPVGSATGNTGILIHANTITNVTAGGNAIDLFGGDGTVAQWNNISEVGGSCSGIMIDSTPIEPVVKYNSVSKMFYEPNVWPLWQICVGAYSYYAHDSTETPVFLGNWVDESSTAVMPDYDICGIRLGGGWCPNAKALIDVPGNATIRLTNANVTLTHNTEIQHVLFDEQPMPVVHYPNGTSWAIYHNDNTDEHYINMTTLPVTVSADQELTVLSTVWNRSASGDEVIAQWNVTAAAPTTLTFEFTGLDPGIWYEFHANEHYLGLMHVNDTGCGSFDYVVQDTTTVVLELRISQLQSIVSLTYQVLGLLIIVAMFSLLMGIVVGSTRKVS